MIRPPANPEARARFYEKLIEDLTTDVKRLMGRFPWPSSQVPGPQSPGGVAIGGGGGGGSGTNKRRVLLSADVASGATVTVQEASNTWVGTGVNVTGVRNDLPWPLWSGARAYIETIDGVTAITQAAINGTFLVRITANVLVGSSGTFTIYKSRTSATTITISGYVAFADIEASVSEPKFFLAHWNGDRFVIGAGEC